jgi:PAS domain S-box-containing protein
MRETTERIALEAANVGIWRVDLKSGLDTRDGVLSRILGLPVAAEAVPVEDYFSRVHPDDRPEVEEAWHRALTARGSYDIENRIVRRDGEVRWIRDRGRVITGAEGEPMFVTGAATDITEIKCAERAFPGACTCARNASPGPYLARGRT